MSVEDVEVELAPGAVVAWFRHPGEKHLKVLLLSGHIVKWSGTNDELRALVAQKQ